MWVSGGSVRLSRFDLWAWYSQQALSLLLVFLSRYPLCYFDYTFQYLNSYSICLSVLTWKKPLIYICIYKLIKTEYPECADSSCCWFYQVQQNIVYNIDEVPSLKFYKCFVIKIWYYYDKSIYINNYWQLLWSVVQVYVQKVGILGAQTIYAFDATYYLANHCSLERSVNLVLQGFIHRYTHFRMHIVFSLHCNSFAYIAEKNMKIVRPSELKTP